MGACRVGCINDVQTIQKIFSNSCKDFLSEINPSIIRPKNLTGLEWMEGMNDVESYDSFGDERQKGAVFIDLPLMATIILDLPGLKIMPAHFRAIIQHKNKVFAPQIMEDMFMSSIKALIGGSKILFRLNCGVVATKKYSEIMFIPAKKRIIDKMQLAKILCWCLCQLLGASWEKD